MRVILASSAVIAAALLAVPAAAQAPTGDGAFCVKSAAGPARCMYQTMAQCEQAKGSNASDQCVPRSQAGGTTGSGGAPSSPSPSQQPPGGGNPPR